MRMLLKAVDLLLQETLIRSDEEPAAMETKPKSSGRPYRAALLRGFGGRGTLIVCQAAVLRNLLMPPTNPPALIEAVVILLIPAGLFWFGLIEAAMKLWPSLYG